MNPLVALVVYLVVIPALGGVPCYVIGKRLGVRSAGVAFIPVFGPVIVLLWSIGRIGWMVLLMLVPGIDIAFAIWLLFALPSNHRRSLWWGLALLVPFLGIYAYAFTLAPKRATPVATTERRDWAWL